MTDGPIHCFSRSRRTRGNALAMGATLVAGAILRSPARAAGDNPDSVALAYQPGIGYLPFVVLQKIGSLGKQYPSTKFEWHELSNGATIRDGFLSNTIQIGAPGSAPFLVGWDKGVPWKVLCTSNYLDHWLVAMDPSYKTLRDFKPGDKIAMPGPDSIQGIVLRKALQNEGLDPHLLDQNIVAMSHPDAEAALLSKQIAAHLGSPPFGEDEVRKGGHVVIRQTDAFTSGIASGVVAVQSQFAAQYAQFVAGFYKNYQAAIALILTHPDEATKIYVDYTGGKANPTEVNDLLKTTGAHMFTLPTKGITVAATFMKQIGMLSKAPTYAEIALPIGAGGD